MIAFILKYKEVLGALAAFVIFAGILYWKDYRIKVLEQKLSAAEVSAASYKQSLETLQEETAQRLKAVEEEARLEIERTKGLERILGTIEGTDDDKNGTVSPVLRNTINRLYGRDPNNSASH